MQGAYTVRNFHQHAFDQMQRYLCDTIIEDESHSFGRFVSPLILIPALRSSKVNPSKVHLFHRMLRSAQSFHITYAQYCEVKMDILNLWSRKEKTQPDRLRISRNEFNIIRLIASLAEFRAWTSCSKDHPSKYFAVYYLTVSVVPNSYYHETLCSSLSIRRKTSFRFPHFKI
ncbi:unnamed protein product [Albugo candida]|uniref:Uncharacterized protein n=1 Tax=Albugo candida TaxID=65357 RepID=A0A024GQI9_9STRA|nr:unnamed protein product [Albugo candida]|eukprot:CCI48971.1 unnamed protein product [Albugo candida]